MQSKILLFFLASTLSVVLGAYSDNCTSSFCPVAKVPSFNFSVTGGIISATSQSCCGTKYAACQQKTQEQTCKEILQYNIMPIGANSGGGTGICNYGPSGVAPDCVCQEHFDVESSIKLKFCPKQPDCCVQCQCFGDPHCVAFNQTDAKTWSICDDRTETCAQDDAVCLASTYDGKPCIIEDGFCQRDPSTPEPEMMMYSKFYLKNGVQTPFSVRLVLGLFGSITDVYIKDGPLDYHFYFASLITGGCRLPSGLHLDQNGQLILDTLPSGITMKLQCYNGASLAYRRWDVIYLREPFLGSAISPSGFCKTNQFAEKKPNEGDTQCSNVDKAIQKGLMYQGKLLCSKTISLDACKNKWCSIYYSLYSIFTSPSDCFEYVTRAGKTENQNFLKAVCGSTPRVVAEGTVTYSPDQCKSNSACSYCMSNIIDYPNHIDVNFAPVSTCPDLAPIGLNRKKLSPVASGVEIQRLDGGSWKSIFALLDSELSQCGCKNITSTSPELTLPGAYRVLQCAAAPQPNTGAGIDNCESSPSYSTTINLNKQSASLASYSIPLTTCYDEDRIICNPQYYPKCPPNYKCCNYDRTTQPLAWSNCMQSFHSKTYNKPQFATCGLNKPNNCPLVCV